MAPRRIEHNVKMAVRSVASVGLPAVIQSLQVLSDSDGRTFTVRPGAVRLQPGSIWMGDAILLSVGAGAVHYARGDTLYKQDTNQFVVETYSPATRPAWMDILFYGQRGFALKMAPAFSNWWGPRGSVCAWLSTFGAFYCSNRGDFELGGRYSSQLLESLVGLRTRWNGVFETLVGSMGSAAPVVLEKWVRATDYPALLGVLLGSHGEQLVSVNGLVQRFAEMRESPSEEFETCLAQPMYARIVRRAEEAAQELVPLVERLRSQLRNEPRAS